VHKGLAQLLAIDLDPAPLDKRQAVAAAQDFLPLGGADGLAVHGQADREVEQRVGAQDRRGVPSYSDAHLRPRRLAGLPEVGDADDDPALFKRRDVL
jgi:hypothetical protein